MVNAFVYCWTNHTNGRKYIGYHKGTLEDGYICSSKSPEFWSDWQTHKFTRQIIATGTVEECRSLESAILDSINIMSVEWYNNANSKGIVYTHEVRRKISIGRTGKGKETNASKRPEVKEMRRKQLLHNNPASRPEVKEKMSAAAKKRWSNSNKTCPHCSFNGSGPVMTRWHFDYCKDKV